MEIGKIQPLTELEKNNQDLLLNSLQVKSSFDHQLELRALENKMHNKDMEVIRLKSIANSLREYLQRALPRIHGSDANTEFCHEVHEFVDDLVL